MHEESTDRQNKMRKKKQHTPIIIIIINNEDEITNGKTYAKCSQMPVSRFMY